MTNVVAAHQSLIHAEHLHCEVESENKFMLVNGIEGAEVHFKRLLRSLALQLDPKTTRQIRV